MWYFVYSIIFMFAERSGTDLDKTDAACRNDREPFMKLTETGYAKINLGLDVLGLRPDKYHEVAMVMQTVSLSDTVTITEGPELEVTGPDKGDGEPPFIRLDSCKKISSSMI